MFETDVSVPVEPRAGQVVPAGIEEAQFSSEVSVHPQPL